MSVWKRLGVFSIAILLGLGLALSGVEVFLRWNGHRPWRELVTRPAGPLMHRRDARLGWIPKPDHYIIPAYAPGRPDVRFTLLPDGRRETGAPESNGEPTLAFVGCSLTQGWAISDDETFAFRLQQRFPNARILNYAVGAYGTYQSLLVMEDLLAQPHPPDSVIYGFMEEHESRNVASAQWLLTLSLFSKGDIIATPYCTLDDDGHLQRHPPISYPEWPLRDQSAVMEYLEWWYVSRMSAWRGAQGRAVTEELLRQMSALARKHGVHFGVLLLHLGPEANDHYRTFLRAQGIDFLDCAFPIPANMRVPVDGHPDGQMNARWADCIESKLRDSQWFASATRPGDERLGRAAASPSQTSAGRVLLAGPSDPAPDLSRAAHP